MLPLLLAALLAQTETPDAPTGPNPCHAVPGAASANCPQWRRVFHSDKADAFIDPASVRRTGDTFWVDWRLIYATDRPEGTRSAVTRMRFDCVRRTSAAEYARIFDAAGRQLAGMAMTGELAEPQVVHADGAGNAVLDEFCPTPAA